MKAKLVPIYFQSSQDQEFIKGVENLKRFFSQEADILEPLPLGSPLPEVDAVVFPQILGDAFRRAEEITRIEIPIMVITSDFGTVNMWDWEIVSYLRSRGIKVFAPYDLEVSKALLRSLALKREMLEANFLVFQDNPGKGMQASIFKRFYWWEEECIRTINKKFGISVNKKSLKQLAEKTKNIEDDRARKAWYRWNFPIGKISEEALLSALKLYLALKQEIEENPKIKAVGMNCLNESFYLDTTPCLAWSILFEEQGLIWGCEADLLSMLTKFIVYNTLRSPVMMSNVYPFLMGRAALQHERISSFPKIDEPENHLLIAHCGYFGLMPPSFANIWTLRPRVLQIVDQNATAVDACFPEGPVTLVKIDPSLSRLQMIQGQLKGYVEYPNSDCLRGGIIRVPDGYKVMERLYSHHTCILIGHHSHALKDVASVLGLDVEELK